jgi:hypothetical protein
LSRKGVRDKVLEIPEERMDVLHDIRVMAATFPKLLSKNDCIGLAGEQTKHYWVHKMVEISNLLVRNCGTIMTQLRSDLAVLNRYNGGSNVKAMRDT